MNIDCPTDGIDCPTYLISKVRMTEEDSRSWLAEAAGNYTTNMK